MTSPITTTTKTYRAASEFCAKLAKRCDWGTFWPRSVLGRTATARGHPVMSGRVSRRRIQRPVDQSGSRVTFLRVLFSTFNRRRQPSDREPQTTRPTQRCAPEDHLELFLKESIREYCYREVVGAVSGVFVEVGWRSGLGAGSREVESETKKNEAGSRRRRKRGAGGRSRCVCWPQCALCGCAARERYHTGWRTFCEINHRKSGLPSLPGNNRTAAQRGLHQHTRSTI